MKAFRLDQEVNLAHLDNVEDHVLVEAVQYALGHAVVAPGAVNQQELLQVGKLRKKKNEVQDRPSWRNRSRKMALGDGEGSRGKRSVRITRENRSVPKTKGKAFGSSEDDQNVLSDPPNCYFPPKHNSGPPTVILLTSCLHKYFFFFLPGREGPQLLGEGDHLNWKQSKATRCFSSSRFYGDFGSKGQERSGTSALFTKGTHIRGHGLFPPSACRFKATARAQRGTRPRAHTHSLRSYTPCVLLFASNQGTCFLLECYAVKRNKKPAGSGYEVDEDVMALAA